MIVTSFAFFLFCEGKEEKTKVIKKEEVKLKKKLVMVIANKNFGDEEFNVQKTTFEEKEIDVTVASDNTSIAKGMRGTRIKPDISISQIEPKDYDALVIVGGRGANIFWNDTTIHRIIREFHKEKKIIGAICISPVTLAKAGILKGRQATCYRGVKEELEKEGGEYIAGEIVMDENIITAPEPEAAKIFAATIVKLLQ